MDMETTLRKRKSMKPLETLGKRHQDYQLTLVAQENIPAVWPMQKFIEISERLSDVVRPFSVTFDMVYRELDLPLLNPELVVPKPTWHIQEASLPTGAEARARFKHLRHSEITVDKISSKALRGCFDQAYDQPRQKEGLPTLHSVEMYYTRAQIFGQSLDKIELTHYSETHSLPVEYIGGSYWISAPKDTSIKPPIIVSFLNNSGRLELVISVNWSLWLQPETKEAALLKKALQEIEACGWDLLR